MSDLTQWFERIGLAQYAEVLEQNDIDLELLCDLTDNDFEALGISLGHRKRILRALRDDHPSESDTPPLSSTAGAEHRQLTVMFCDLVGSTQLSGQLDPEDFREILLAYQNACTEVIEQYGGFIARYVGDGILAYFGYPLAHEDDAERSIRAALAIAGAMAKLQEDLGAAADVPLATRIGVCTGRTVVGDVVGKGAAREQTAVGEIPNIASRLQDVCEGGQVVIGESTLKLVEGLFEVRPLGDLSLRGVRDPVRAFVVERESSAASAFEASAQKGLISLIGRDAEVDLILKRWEAAKAGESQVVGLISSAGLGKSRIVREIKDRAAHDSPNRVLYFCSAHHVNSALYPVSQQFRRVLDFRSHESPADRVGKLKTLVDDLGCRNSEAVPLLAELAGLPATAYKGLNLGPAQHRQRTMNAVVDIIECMSRRAPVLMVIEDFQWVDPTTGALIESVIERLRHARLLVLVTSRSELRTGWCPLPNVTRLTLNHLTRADSQAVIRAVASPRSLGIQTEREVLERTDGVPLFIQELTKLMLEDHYPTDTTVPEPKRVAPHAGAIPSSLHDSLMASLDRLGDARELTQIAAVLGRRFDHDFLARVSGLTSERLDADLRAILDAGILQRHGHAPGLWYEFNQALCQDAAYQSLLKSVRRKYHARASEVLLADHPHRVEAQPEGVAHHLTEAGNYEEAIPFWTRAGRIAFNNSHNQEAVAHLEKALELLEQLAPGHETDRLELDIRLTLGGAMGTIQGWASPAVEKNYEKAKTLCRERGDDHELFTVEWGLWLCHQQGGRMKSAKTLADEILSLADRIPNSDYWLQAHHAAWTTAERTADFETCRYHAEKGIAIYDRDKHHAHAYTFGGHDPGVCAAMHLSSCQAELGLVDQAVESILLAEKLASDINDSVSEALSLLYGAKLFQARGEADKCLDQASRLVAISLDQGYASLEAQGRIMQGWAMAACGDLDDGVSAMVEGLENLEATGAQVRVPYFLTLLSMLYHEAGDTDRAVSTIREARSVLARSGETTHEADLYRVEGELAAAKGDVKTGAEKLTRAIELAESQNARAPKLRAATSLSRVWVLQGETSRARDLLQAAYDDLSEGFDTRDPSNARQLLESLGK